MYVKIKISFGWWKFLFQNKMATKYPFILVISLELFHSNSHPIPLYFSLLSAWCPYSFLSLSHCLILSFSGKTKESFLIKEATKKKFLMLVEWHYHRVILGQVTQLQYLLLFLSFKDIDRIQSIHISFGAQIETTMYCLSYVIDGSIVNSFLWWQKYLFIWPT